MLYSYSYGKSGRQRVKEDTRKSFVDSWTEGIPTSFRRLVTNADARFARCQNA